MVKKEDIVFGLTSELHDDVANIYESIIDKEDEEAFKMIDELRRKLKALKDNLIKKDSI